MKKIYTLIACLLFAMVANAQLSSGLVAHWPFNGNVNDSTGNGHNGKPKNITYASGKLGTTNTAAQFDGTTSLISVSSKADMNLYSHSFCAIVKPTAFYNGFCQSSRIITRGLDGAPASFYLELCDNPFDSSNVTTDTNNFVFASRLGLRDHDYNKPNQYSPTTRTNSWYCVIATFDTASGMYHVYIDGVLKTNARASSHSPLTTSVDSIIIGHHEYNGPTYPFWYKGLMDDLRIYNRALNQADVTSYCNLFTKQSESVENARANSILELYPNPAKGYFTLSGHISAGKVKLQIINAVGQVVYTEEWLNSNNNLLKTIQMRDWAKGVYIIQLQTTEGIKTSKLEIQ